MVLVPDAILTAILSIFLYLALSGALALVTVSLRKPANTPLITAAGLVIAALLVVAIAPANVPIWVGLGLAMLGTAVAVVGGDPVTRRILDIATRGSVREGIAGGILVQTPPRPGAEDDPSAIASTREVMRGGTTIGYLERTAVAVAIIAGFPEAIAVVVAVKGVGRFSELSEAQSRERFIIGTLSSLLWAAVLGGLIRLAIW
nr:hypothetical protein [Microbacterium lemovicicum]